MGSVADAAIATLLCMGVIHNQSMGIGGGFFMVTKLLQSFSPVLLNIRIRYVLCFAHVCVGFLQCDN